MTSSEWTRRALPTAAVSPFPLFHGMRFGGGRIEFSSSSFGLSEDDMVRRKLDPLN